MWNGKRRHTKKAPSKWNLFVKKIFHEGKRSNPNYAFKNALADASRRKGEMDSVSSSSSSSSLSSSPFMAPKNRNTRARTFRRKQTRRRR